MRKLLIISLIFTSQVSFASAYKLTQAQCSDVDIRDKHPKLREHLSTPLDQGNIGWCYGYSAADLLSVEAGVPLSPSHVSSIYNKSIRSSLLWKTGYGIRNLFTESREPYEGGFIGKATVEAMKDSPICQYNTIDRYTHLIGLLEYAKYKVNKNEMSNEDACSIVERVLPNIGKSESFMNDFITKNMNDTLEGLLRQNCQAVEVPKREKKVLNRPILFGKNKYMENVNKLLEQGKPLGISYNVKHVAKDLKGFHASTVIGRRWNNGRCEYNIRNSWGRLCNYKEGIECNPDDGSYWIKDEDFYSIALNFTYLE